MNHHRLGEPPAAATRLIHHHSTIWTNINNNTPRFYGNGCNVISSLNYPQIPSNSAFPNDEKKGEVQDHVSLDLHL